jgi:predicted RNA-binding protein associated with RNAse of E/G family
VPLSAGETVVVQEVWRGRVWAARPMRVVQDDGEFTVLWFPKGTRWKAPTSDPARAWHEDRGERLAACAASGEWIFRDGEWDVSTLWLMREGDWHAVWVSWLPDGTHWGWYVNLQRPYRRTVLGFETMDLMLDVIVETDRSWRLKDEDELETFVARGVFDHALADRVRREALSVARRAERNEPPFGEPWPRWRPDRSWGLPRLPRGWEEPCP